MRACPGVSPRSSLPQQLLSGLSASQVLILLYMRPQCTIYASSYYYVPSASACIWSCRLTGPHTTVHVSSMYYICVLMLLCTFRNSLYLVLPPHRSSYSCICVLNVPSATACIWSCRLTGSHTPVYASSMYLPHQLLSGLSASQVLVPLYMCPHTTMYVSSYYYVPSATARICSCRLTGPHTTMYVSSYYCICVLILLYMCPHTTIYVSSYYYMCPHTTTHVSSYYYVPSARILVLVYISVDTQQHLPRPLCKRQWCHQCLKAL
jgi:hypothetical protein